MSRHTFASWLVCLLSGSHLLAQNDDILSLEQASLKAAADAVAESVVQIETIGGLEVIEPSARS